MKKIADQYSRTYLKGGEILLAIRESPGGCAIVPKEMTGYNISREIAMIPLTTHILNYYFLDVLTSPYIQEITFNKLRGIAYKRLNLSLLNNFLIPLHPINEQKRIVKKVNELIDLCKTLEEKGEMLVGAVMNGVTTN